MLPLYSSQWLGAKGSSSGSKVMGTSGLELRIDSTSVIKVFRTSSVTTCSFMKAHRMRQVEQISLS